MDFFNNTKLRFLPTKGLEPVYAKFYIRKIKMKDYPNTVCIECLQEACDDTKIHRGSYPKWSYVFSTYVDKCQICGEITECTEPSDAGYPTFEYLIQRIRTRKINKLKSKIHGSLLK